MLLSNLPLVDRTAIQAALQYWLAKWDWECPTLFGLEREQVQQVLDQWDESTAGDERVAALAVNGALRELLYGASAVQRSEVAGVCGLSFEAADDLSRRIHDSVRHAL